ncbi:MAG: polysaccharide biosynthesis/export family protein [Acidobacteriota bacterium]
MFLRWSGPASASAVADPMLGLEHRRSRRAVRIAPVGACLFLGVLIAGAAFAQSGYRVGPSDRVSVRVAELPSLDGEREISDDGSLILPVIGSVEAAGLTEATLAERIRSRLLEEGLRQATVTVTVLEYRSRPVSIMGSVAEPGNQFVRGRSTLLEVLLAAGGLSADHGETVTVRRRADNGLAAQLEIPVRDLVERGIVDYNIPIFAGDTIHVPRARRITIHFLGEVATPGSLAFEGGDRPTLLTAVARAGGLTENASSRIAIKRLTESGERIEIEADFKRLLAGRDSDIALQDGDLVVVKESFF